MPRYVGTPDDGRTLDATVSRPKLIDEFRSKIEECVDRSNGKVRAQVALEWLSVMGFTGTERAKLLAVAQVQASWNAKPHRRAYRPWLSEPGWWLLCKLM